MADMKDFNDVVIFKGDEVAFTDSERTDLVKGLVLDFGDKMITIERIGTGWPKKVRRYPNQVLVID